MKSFSRLFLALGAFLIVSLAIYGWQSREYEGVLLSITVAVAALIFGGYGALVVRRSRAALAHRRPMTSRPRSTSRSNSTSRTWDRPSGRWCTPSRRSR